MNNYLFLELSQKHAIPYLLGQRPVAFTQESFSFGESLPVEISKGSCLLLWDGEDSNLPFAVIGERETLLKLLPKVMALPNSPSQITSVFGMWELRSMHALQARLPIKNGGRIEGFVALVLGELLGRIGSNLSLSNVGTSSARRTFSYFSAKMAVSGTSPRERHEGIMNWIRVSDLTQNSIQSDLLDTANYLSAFVEFISGSHLSAEHDIGLLIRDWLLKYDTHQTGTDLINQLIKISKELKRSPREERFEAVISIIENINLRFPESHPLSTLLAGYAISLIDPDSLNFLSFAQDLEQSSPGVISAYVMCIALKLGPQFLFLHGGLGLHLSRSIQSTEWPVDISILELDILERMSRVSDGIQRTATPSLLEVELLPKISATFHYGQRRSENSTALANNRAAAKEAKIKEIQIGELTKIEKSILDTQQALLRLKNTISSSN